MEQLSKPTTSVRRLFDAFRRGNLAGNEPRERTPVKHGRHKRLSPANIDALFCEYCDGLGSIYELADHWGVHRNTIAKHLKSRGLELGRLSLTSDEIRRVSELRKRGLSINAIGRAIGKDPKTVRAALY
jgi:lambda repressor-like predicted transcriptional regulator